MAGVPQPIVQSASARPPAPLVGEAAKKRKMPIIDCIDGNDQDELNQPVPVGSSWSQMFAKKKKPLPTGVKTSMAAEHRPTQRLAANSSSADNDATPGTHEQPGDALLDGNRHGELRAASADGIAMHLPAAPVQPAYDEQRRTQDAEGSAATLSAAGSSAAESSAAAICTSHTAQPEQPVSEGSSEPVVSTDTRDCMQPEEVQPEIFSDSHEDAPVNIPLEPLGQPPADPRRADITVETGAAPTSESTSQPAGAETVPAAASTSSAAMSVSGLAAGGLAARLVEGLRRRGVAAQQGRPLPSATECTGSSATPSATCADGAAAAVVGSTADSALAPAVAAPTSLCAASEPATLAVCGDATATANDATDAVAADILNTTEFDKPPDQASDINSVVPSDSLAHAPAAASAAPAAEPERAAEDPRCCRDPRCAASTSSFAAPSCFSSATTASTSYGGVSDGGTGNPCSLGQGSGGSTGTNAHPGFGTCHGTCCHSLAAALASHCGVPQPASAAPACMPPVATALLLPPRAHRSNLPSRPCGSRHAKWPL